MSPSTQRNVHTVHIIGHTAGNNNDKIGQVGGGGDERSQNKQAKEHADERSEEGSCCQQLSRQRVSHPSSPLHQETTVVDRASFA